MPDAELVLYVRSECVEVLRESDGNMLALVSVREATTGMLIDAAVFDPRLEDEDAYDDLAFP